MKTRQKWKNSCNDRQNKDSGKVTPRYKEIYHNGLSSQQDCQDNI